MASVKSAASSVVLGFLGLYLILWNTMKTVLGGLYGALRTLSGIYPPANHFLTNLEKTMHRLKTDPSVCAELNLQSLLQEFWSPATLLEGLGQISVAVPVSMALLCTTGALLFASLLVTCVFAICVTLCLPVGLCCAVGYSIGTVTKHLVGYGVSGLSAVGSRLRRAISRVIGRVNPGNSANSKNHTPSTSDDKTSSGAPEEDSPRISASVEKNAEEDVQFVN